MWHDHRSFQGNCSQNRHFSTGSYKVCHIFDICVASFARVDFEKIPFPVNYLIVAAYNEMGEGASFNISPSE